MNRIVLVTGSNGFIGKNLIVALRRLPGIDIREFDLDKSVADLARDLGEAQFIYHLAGVNRPERVEEFESGNAGLTRRIVEILEETRNHPPIVLSSSSQAALGNPYGDSKKKAEEILIEYGRRNRVPVYLYRLPNVFGKWCRPNYNSVVATFCHNICRGLDIVVSDPDKELAFVYIDDVVEEFVNRLLRPAAPAEGEYRTVDRTHRITVGGLAEKIYHLRDIRRTLRVPDLSDPFTRALQATYLSYLEPGNFSSKLEMKSDARGSLAEFIKSGPFGQIFVSRTRPGIVRGNHYHDSKVEKFCVISGRAVIRFRHVLIGDVLSYPVSGASLEVVDIPPGYTHSIENVGQEDLITLFWANEIFDPTRTDTYPLEVKP